MKLREDRWWNFPLAFALLAALMVTSFKIESTGWTENLYTLKWLTFIGFFLGSAFGYSYFSTTTTRILLLAYAIIILPWSFALQYGNELTWSQRLSNVSGRFGISLGQFFNNIQSGRSDTFSCISFISDLDFSRLGRISDDAKCETLDSFGNFRHYYLYH